MSLYTLLFVEHIPQAAHQGKTAKREDKVISRRLQVLLRQLLIGLIALFHYTRYAVDSIRRSHRSIL